MSTSTKCLSSLLGFVCVLRMAPIFAATDLYFSEYIEGSGNNKALEIYNPSNHSIDLSSYQIQFYFNGSRQLGRSIQLSGVIAAKDVLVVANSHANELVLKQADLAVAGTWFNGDDVIALTKANKTIDVIGQMGNDPGTAWGKSRLSTKDHTLRRKHSVTSGDGDANDEFDPAREWDGYAKDSFDDLGKYRRERDTTPSVANTAAKKKRINNGAACGKAAIKINRIQGDSEISPVAGQLETVEAVVTASFQENSPGLSGFFVQEEAEDMDDNDKTSEGLFVFDNGFGVKVQVGDLVRVTGKVVEFHNLTELNAIKSVVVCKSGLKVAASELRLPLTRLSELEAVEGMLVRLPQTLTVSGNNNLGRYGELLLSAGERLYTPTQVVAPGAKAIAQQRANDLNKIILDDGNSMKNPQPIIYPFPRLTAKNTLRVGDSVKDIVAVVSYAADSYRLHPTQTPTFLSTNPHSRAPLLPGKGRLRVASFNVLNYFNGNGQGSGFPTARGATTASEFKRQRDKIIAAITNIRADIVGVMEIENDGYTAYSAIQDLVNGVNQIAVAGDRYRFIDPGLAKLGTDAISVAIIYRDSRVEPIGKSAILQTTVDSRFDDEKNRPTLAQTFKEIVSGARLTIAVNHFKSKGSPCANDADTGDGQGNCNVTRNKAAQALVAWLATDPSASGDSDRLIIGDLNSYAMEDPVTTIESANYVNLIHKFEGTHAYSYVFNGQSGTLDHAFASASLAPQVTGVATWHINADEPNVLDYNEENKSTDQSKTLYLANPYRASDHDPIVIELDLKP